jgi:hypothetical protein
MKAPTDLKLLSYIYDLYYPEFVNYSKDEPERDAKIYVPINCAKVAAHFKVDPDIVFGRLYYHLEEKYGYKRSDGSRVHFFALRLNEDIKCINFPLLSSVVAGLRDESSRFWLATWISLAAAAVSVLSLGISLGSG